ncbi:hypothetical protein D3C72_266510 [compost metagenome]
MISILFLIIWISSCDNKTSELDFEKKVMLEIYPSIIDSICVSKEISFSSSLSTFNKNGKLQAFESKIKLRENYNQTLAKIKEDTSRIFVTVDPIIVSINQDDKKELSKHFKKAILSKGNRTDSTRYLIDTMGFGSIKYLKVKFTSKKNYRLEGLENRYRINGIVSFSRIQFDNEKKYGVLTTSVICGGLCGQGYRIFIKKAHGKWIIDKFKETWIA